MRPRLSSIASWAGVAAFALALLAFQRWRAGASAHIGTAHPEVDYVLGLAWALVLGAAIWLVPLPARDRRTLTFAWGAKTLVTLGFMLVFESYYAGLDAYAYFADAYGPWSALGPITDATENMRRIAWLHVHVIPSFHALMVSFAFAGLVATYVLYRAACRFMEREDPRILLALAFFPSMLFWSSMIAKDAIVLVGIALVVYAAVCLRREEVRRGILYGASAAALFFFIRPWLIPLTLVPLASIPALIHLRSAPRRKKIFLAFLAVAFLGAAFISMGALFNITSSQGILDYAQRVSRGWAIGGSSEVPPEFHSLGDLLAFLPWGAFTALFRPLPGELRTFFGTLAGVESLVLLVISVYTVAWTRRRHFREPLFTAGVLFVILWATMYGIVSYQNLGTAVRFRLQVIPVILLLAAYVRSAHASEASDAVPGRVRSSDPVAEHP